MNKRSICNKDFFGYLQARPGKNLWVGGVCPSVSKEQLESEFSKFGKIEEYKFLRDRNSALINYYKVDDAIAALKNMNGKRLGGEQLRVDYLRSQPSRRVCAIPPPPPPPVLDLGLE